MLKRAAVAVAWALSLAPAGHAQAPRDTVTVELGDVSLTKLPILMAYDHGIFERNGLKVDMFITPRAAEAVREEGVSVPAKNIRSGVVADINIGGGAPTLVRMTTVAQTPRRIILATMDNVVRFHIITRGDVTSTDQLKGLRFGYSGRGSLDHLAILLLFRRLCIDPVHDVEMYEGAGSTGDIVNGRVDAIAGSELAIAAAKGDGLTDLQDMGKYDYPMLGSGVMALSGWLPAHRDEAARFMQSTVEAIAMMKTDPMAADESLTRWFGITDPQRLATVLNSAQRLPSKPTPSVAGLALLQSLIDYRALARTRPEDVLDPSFVEALDKSGLIDRLNAPK